MEYPKGVKNKKAYKELQILLEHPYFKDENVRFVETSDYNVTVDLQLNKSTVAKLISHLPEKERKAIIVKNQAALDISMKSMRLKRLAYSIDLREGKYAITQSILDPIKGKIIAYFARMYPFHKVHNMVLSEGYEVSSRALRDFKKRYQEVINEEVEKYLKDPKDVMFFHQRTRMDALENLYYKREQKYIENNFTLEDEKRLLDILEQFQREAKADKKVNSQSELNNPDFKSQYYNQTLQAKYVREMPLHHLTIVRVAARTNVDPTRLMYSLETNWYAKQAGFAPTNEDDPEFAFPSEIPYDWDKIKAYHNRGGEDAEYDAAHVEEEITEEDKKRANITREKMLRILADIMKETKKQQME